MHNQQSKIDQMLAKIKKLKKENAELHTSVKELETQVTNAQPVVKEVGVLKMDIEMVEQFESQLDILVEQAWACCCAPSTRPKPYHHQYNPTPTKTTKTT